MYFTYLQKDYLSFCHRGDEGLRGLRLWPLQSIVVNAVDAIKALLHGIVITAGCILHARFSDWLIHFYWVRLLIDWFGIILQYRLGRKPVEVQ